MTSPSELAAGLRAHTQGLYCGEAAAEPLIAQSWLHRPDFTSRFITVHPRHPGRAAHGRRRLGRRGHRPRHQPALARNQFHPLALDQAGQEPGEPETSA